MAKPKYKTKKYLSASEVKSFIKKKYKNNGSKFWDWIFSESDWGEDNLVQIIEPEFMYPGTEKYFSFLEKEFADLADEEGQITIENDL